MAGTGIEEMGMPPRRYRLDLHIADFETDEFSRKEDLKRAKSIARALRTYPRLYPTELRAVRKTLLRTAVPLRATLASSRHFRRLRSNVLGHLFHVWHTSRYRRVTTVHLIPRGWDFTPRELMQADPNKLLETFRLDLSRCGSANADGYLAAFLHGEFDRTTERYQLHMHGLVAGGMVDVLDGLRDLPKYATGGDPGRLSVRRRLVMSGMTLTNMPAPLTYLLKAYWNWSLILEKDGVGRRHKAKSRMPEPFHSIYLLWLHRLKLGDVSLLVGMRPGKDGLILTRAPKPINPPGCVHE